MKAKAVSMLARVLVGIGLIAALIIWIGTDSLDAALTEFHPLYYSGAVLLLFAHFFVQSLIIRILLAAKHTRVRARHIFRVIIIANFFGVFLPGGSGPDMVLCYNMVRSTENKEVGLSAIIFIRISVLFVMTLAAFVAGFHPLASGIKIHLITGGVLSTFLFYFFIMANRNTLALASKLLGFLNRHRLTAILYKTYFAVADHGRNQKTLVRIAPLLLASAFIKISTDYIISRALGFEIPLLYFFVFVPIITVISAVPLTFAGLGIREGSFVALFTLAGVPPEQAITVSLVSFSLLIVVALIGAILYSCSGATLITTHATATGAIREGSPPIASRLQ